MKHIAAALITLSALISAPASANLLTNGSFESGSFVNQSGGYMAVPVGSGTITGWEVIDNQPAWAQSITSEGLTSQEGSYFLDLTGFGNVTPNAGVRQSFSTVAGQTYDVSFWLGGYAPFGPTVVLTATAGATTQTFTLNPGNANTWVQHQFSFVATGSSSTLSLRSIQQGNNYYTGLDNVSVTAAVPEPETYALMLAGLALVAGQAKRRQRRQTAKVVAPQ